MPRWLWFMPLAALTLALAVWGFRIGYISAHLTETEAINHYAERYLQDRARAGTGQGARKSDCVAYPGQTRGVWIIVDCGPVQTDPARRYVYQVNRFGGFEYGALPSAETAIPRTLEPET